MALELSDFPLQQATAENLQSLAHSLWGWQICGGCRGKLVCYNAQCPWSRAKRLGTFWNRYREVTEAYVPEFYATSPALSDHADLFVIIDKLLQCPDLPRKDLVHQQYENYAAAAAPAIADLSRSFNIAASTIISTNCGMPHECADDLELGTNSLPWQDDLSMNQLAETAFLTQPLTDLHDSEQASRVERMSRLSARSLKKEIGIRCEPTEDLRSHLELDVEGRILYVYHDVMFLKETLVYSSSSIGPCLIPRDFILEILDTIHNVLFPSDAESQALLLRLVSKHRFDKELLQYDSARYRTRDDLEITYKYFGGRLMELERELKNPKPRTKLENWFEKKSGARYMLMATMIGVFIAVILGFLGLVVAVFQAWVGYQQWKHPVSSG